MLASTVVNKLYLSFRPFVTHGFCEFRFGSLFTIESRFGSLRVGILIIVSRHCSSDTVECSADILMRSATASRAQKRTQTGASSNAYFTCFIFQSTSLGFSIFQLTIYTLDSEELTKNKQRTERTRKVQLQSSHSVVFKFISFMFSCSHN